MNIKNAFTIEYSVILFFLVLVTAFTSWYFGFVNTKKILGLLVSLVGLHLAFTAYFKASELWDSWLVYSITDRCITWETQLNKTHRIVTPYYINQGGDALAYEDLTKMYRELKSNDEKKRLLKKQLEKVYENVISAKKDYVDVDLDSYFDKENKLHFDTNGYGKRIQTSEMFYPKSIVGQLKHPTYWMTRAKCAILLRSENSLKEFNSSKLKFEMLMKDFSPEDMFENLVSLIKEDYSLLVRKEALETYIFWACNNKECERNFKNDKIFYFNKIDQHWRSNKTPIIEKFKKRTGVEVQYE